MNNNLQEFHDHIRMLMDGVSRLQESVQEFADSSGLDMSKPQTSNAQSLVDNIDISNFGAMQSTQQFENVKDATKNVSDIVNGINIDELMANVDTSAMMP